MPRYYLNAEYPNGVLNQDEDGCEFATIEDAVAEAKASLRELAIDAWRSGLTDKIPANMTVRDEANQVATVVSMRDVLPAALAWAK